ncbi:hypothetical protein OKA04_13905 [Luteolibacter flavescens]|uniref:Uncharacterized protein n=1 Tax=Luteolibacter flavescens TaxID=1859460 RepID=A0ABT3FQI7_9BACT|nr:hypothetical protein [Luteolibacter flavescens]MCW1885830.1 hypothetical protein [Luteolibacter flavescens]
MAGRKAILLVFVALGGIVGWMSRSPAPADTASVGTPPKAPATATKRAEPGHKALVADWRECLAQCENGADPEALAKLLRATKNAWLEEEPDVVAQTIGQLLRSGVDAETGIPFETGPGRALVGWPTLRVFLLDVLSVTDPDLAMEIAREVLGTTGSAEEFAVALKPLTHGKTWRASDEELAGYFSKMLGTPAWQDSAGLAEALDLSRFVSSPEIAETLARWVDQSSQPGEAGALALHETTAEAPALMSGLITSDDTLFAGQPDLRASLMARANVSDATQAEHVEAYLRNPAIPDAEKQQFLTLFPLRSATTGYRLYGNPPSPFAKEQVQADDRAALEKVNIWKSDPAFAPLAKDISALEARLQSWSRQPDN